MHMINTATGCDLEKLATAGRRSRLSTVVGARLSIPIVSGLGSGNSRSATSPGPSAPQAAL